MERTFLLSQIIAVFCIIFGAGCVALGCVHHWAEMNTLGAGIAGAGIQAFVSQSRKDNHPAQQ